MAFGSARKLGFAGLVIGFLMCLLGDIAPFWLQTDRASREIGLWWYCGENYYVTKCYYNDLFDLHPAKVWVFRLASIFSFIISVSAIAAGRSRNRGNIGGKTVALGVTIFSAGAVGIITIAVFAAYVKEYNILSIYHYGWAFYVYIVGIVFHVLASVIFCFAPPDSTEGQVLTGTQMGTVMVSTSAQQMYGAPQHQNQAYNWQQQPQIINNQNYGQQYVERKQAY